jgi:hypothetical protein
MKKYYLYRHIRLDKNEPFYIGIGKVSSNIKNYSIDSEHYRRAYSNTNRNRYWKHVTQMTDYVVEILFESDNREIIIQKEIEFITLYGRKDLKQGSLVNMTSGGEGTIERSYSSETKIKMSTSAKRNITHDRKIKLINQLDKNHSTRGKFGKDHPRAFEIYQYDLDNNLIEVWDSMSDIQRELTFNISHISQCVNNKRKTAYKFKWSKSRI